MKNLSKLLFILFPTFCWATPPEIIQPKTRVIRSATWYADQALQWKESLSNSSASGWLNYYAASRYSQAPQTSLDAIVTEAERAAPGTFEVMVIQSWNEGFSQTSRMRLEQAYKENASNPSTYG